MEPLQGSFFGDREPQVGWIDGVDPANLGLMNDNPFGIGNIGRAGNAQDRCMVIWDTLAAPHWMYML